MYSLEIKTNLYILQYERNTFLMNIFRIVCSRNLYSIIDNPKNAVPLKQIKTKHFSSSFVHIFLPLRAYPTSKQWRKSAAK